MKVIEDLTHTNEKKKKSFGNKIIFDTKSQ